MTRRLLCLDTLLVVRDCPGEGASGVGGYTYGDHGKIYGGPQEHRDGEIWGETMWDLRSSLIQAYGPAGIERVERLMVSAMQLSLPFPSFLDMRNALLDADRVTGGSDQDRIWSVFAKRGMGFFASTSIDPEDPSPVQDFSLPPAPGSPRGTFAGKVTDVITKEPVAGARVIVSGQLTGITATTDARGRFRIPDLPVGTYPLIDVLASGYDVAEIERVTIKAQQTTTKNFRVLRNWGSSAAGARVTGFTGPRYKTCGPTAALDQDPTSWVTTRGRNRQMTIKLARAVDILIFGITPGINCPDSSVDPSSAAALIRIDVAGESKRFRRVVTRKFRRAQNALSVVIDPGERTFDRTRYVRVTLLKAQGPLKDAEEPEVSFRSLIGLGELEVYGIPSK